jgi:hypothetical protein
MSDEVGWHEKGCTARQWKVRKRREWKAVMQALEQYAMGCGHAPEYATCVDILAKAKQVQAALSKWGR